MMIADFVPVDEFAPKILTQELIQPYEIGLVALEMAAQQLMCWQHEDGMFLILNGPYLIRVATEGHKRKALEITAYPREQGWLKGCEFMVNSLLAGPEWTLSESEGATTYMVHSAGTADASVPPFAFGSQSH